MPKDYSILSGDPLVTLRMLRKFSDKMVSQLEDLKSRLESLEGRVTELDKKVQAK